MLRCVFRYEVKVKDWKLQAYRTEDVKCLNPKADWYGTTIFVNAIEPEPKKRFPNRKSRCIRCCLRTTETKELEKGQTRLSEIYNLEKHG